MIAALLLALAAPVAGRALPVAQDAAPAVEVWRVAQLRVAADTAQEKIKALTPDHTMEAVIARLRRLGVSYTRAEVGMVPSRMPEALRSELAKLPQGEPFVIPMEDAITINVIIARQLPPDTVRFAPRPARRAERQA